MVHSYSMNGVNVAVDGNSGSVHILDDLTYKMLTTLSWPFTVEEAKNQFSQTDESEKIQEAWEEIKILSENKSLFSPPIQKEELLKDFKHTQDLKALCLHIAHDCNLMCDYCFASKGSYKIQKSLMPIEVAKKAVDFLVENSGNRKNIEIDFFGGEPLLNFDVVKETVQYGRSIEEKIGKRFHFTVTTNGTLLDEDSIGFINENMDNVVISLDGRKKVHDGIRCDVTGHGTYDVILENTKKLVEKRGNKSHFVRGTFSSRNLDFSEDVMHLADLGFKEISVEPVVGAGEDFHIRREHIPAILQEYERLATKYLERIKDKKAFRFYHFCINLYKGPCIYKRISACGAGSEYFAVTPEGELYPCHQFVGQSEFKMGSLETGIENTTLRKTFKDSNIFSKEECGECWAKLYCSGGCHANAFYSNGDILKADLNFCDMQKKRVECAIAIEVAKLIEDENEKNEG